MLAGGGGESGGGGGVDVFFDGDETLGTNGKFFEVPGLTTDYAIIGVLTSMQGMGLSYYQKLFVPAEGYSLRDTSVYMSVRTEDDILQVSATNSGIRINKVFGIRF